MADIELEIKRRWMGGDAPITSQPGASASFVAPDGEERLAQFVATGDLSLLPIEAEKAVDAFNAYQCYCACLVNLALTVAGAPCVVAIFCPGKFCPSVRGDITRKSYLSLSAEEVVLSQPDVDLCCHIADQKATIPLDIITDVEVKESCIDRCAGTKCLQMHAIGYKSKGTAPQFLRNPEAWREALLVAIRAKKAESGKSSKASASALANRIESIAALEKSGELQALGVTKVELLYCARDFAALHLAAVNLKESAHLSDEELGEFRARVATAVRQECAK